MKKIVATHEAVHPDLYPQLPELLAMLRESNQRALDIAWGVCPREVQEKFLLAAEWQFNADNEQMQLEQEQEREVELFLMGTRGM